MARWGTPKLCRRWLWALSVAAWPAQGLDFCPGEFFDPLATAINCTSNNPSNCRESVGCLERGITETWELRLTSDLGAPPIDIPLCPHAHLDRRRAARPRGPDRDASAPLGYLFSGEPLWAGRPLPAGFLTPEQRALVGFAVDGFPIFGGGAWPDQGLDRCNGAFVATAEAGSSTGGPLYSYAYYLTTNRTHAKPPFTMGCLVSAVAALFMKQIRR
jgi:hypothetical protein